MSDDEVDLELLDLLRKSLGTGNGHSSRQPAETKVLESARYIFDNAIDVALSAFGTKKAAGIIWHLMNEKEYSTKTWSQHELHPKSKDMSAVNFILTMDLLNFSFWSDDPDKSRQFAVEYKGKQWTGYWGLVAALHRALEEEIPITTPDFWLNKDEFTEDVLRHIFRSATDEEIPLFHDRLQCLREAGQVLDEKFDGNFANCIYDADHSAAALVNLLAENFASFQDEATFEGRRVRFYKRAQILVADLWACFEGKDYGEFHDIDKITMFADYRIPQMLHQLGCMLYSPPLDSHIRQLKQIKSKSTWEIELRGASIWCIELIRQEIERRYLNSNDAKMPGLNNRDADGVHDEDLNRCRTKEEAEMATKKEDQNSDSKSTKPHVNAILIDFFLYDTVKQLEQDGREMIPHHRTRSIWY